LDFLDFSGASIAPPGSSKRLAPDFLLSLAGAGAGGGVDACHGREAHPLNWINKNKAQTTELHI
jgi:hypothetical protein